MRARTSRRYWLLPVILFYGLLNVVLYAMLLPLWDGFDEPFHYGYVQALDVHRAFPRLGQTILSEEIWQSLHYAPASHVVRRNLAFVMTFQEFAALPDAERAARREGLASIPPSFRAYDLAGAPNYEAQQAPLAYSVLAVGDHLSRRWPLLPRALAVRLLGAVAATLLEFGLCLVLAGQLRLSPAARASALFFVFSCQMYSATVSHIANDWLAVPLATLVLIAAIGLYDKPDVPHSILLALAVSAGLLTKAYFLSFGLFAVGLLAWMLWQRRLSVASLAAAALTVAVLAGPWYARNLWLYHSLSGTQQSNVLTTGSILRAALDFPWRPALVASARGAIWSGNNSFTAFSSITIDTVICLMFTAAALWLWSTFRDRGRRREWIVAAGCFCFVVALLYANALFYAFTKGGIYSAAPWYPQAVSAPLACLLCAGCERSGIAGKLLASFLCVASAYLNAATYLVKLIPLYGGFTDPRMHVPRLLHWYLENRTHWQAVLADTILGDARLVLILTAAVVLLGPLICVVLCRRWWTGKA